MNTMEPVIIAVLGSLLTQALALVVIPALLLIAAGVLWRCVPRWIPCVMGGAAIIRVLTGIPSLLMHPLLRPLTGGFTPEQYGKTAMFSAILGWPAAIALPIAILALAIEVRRGTAGR